MKKSILLIASLLLITGSSFAKIKIVTTLTVLKSISEEVGGDKISVIALSRWNEDPHFVVAKPSFILKLRRTNLYVEVGVDLESWNKSLIQNSRNPNIMPGSQGYVDASEGINLLEKPSGRVDRSMGDIHPFGNPHYWLDPENAKIIAQNIYNGLVRIDVENKNYYSSRLKQFKEKCDKIISEVKKMFSKVRNRKVIAFHKNWIYFTKRFGLVEAGYLELKPGVSPSATHLSKIIKLIKKEKIKLIIQANYYSSGIAKKVSITTGTLLLRLPTSVGGTTKNYFQLIRNLGKKISQALK